MQSAAHCNARQVLGPVRWRLGLRRLERSALYGLTIGAATGAFLLLLGRAGLLPDTRAAALALVAAGTVAGALTSTRRWPGMVDAARAVDRHFALQDRMTTALELEAHQ